MNEQIKLFAIKCGAEDSSDFGACIPRDENFEISKFAELIVKECITICNSSMGYSESYNSGRMDCVSDIKRHFGVRE